MKNLLTKEVAVAVVGVVIVVASALGYVGIVKSACIAESMLSEEKHSACVESVVIEG